MDAMLFAAGLGTRLRPLTDSIPKALIPVAGVPMLERVARRVVAAGADRLIINTHHHAGQIERFVVERDGFGVDVRFSHEPGAPLETGGGLVHAAKLLRRDAPIVLHNTDILSDLPLERMYAEHAASGALATLAVMRRETSRMLLFDDLGLCGHSDARTGTTRWARPARGEVRSLAFCGVHVVSPRLLDLLTERGAFPIFDAYLRLAGDGHTIRSFAVDGFFWLDVGSPQRIADAERSLRQRPGP